MSASYPTSVKSFTSRSAGQAIASAHVNDLQDEVTAIETALLGTLASPTEIATAAFADYAGTSSITGWSSFTGGAGRKVIYYKKIGKLVLVNFHLEGTSNSVNTSFTLPYTAVSIGASAEWTGLITFQDNGGASTFGRWTIADATATVTLYTNAGTTGWTASGTKAVSGQLWYQANA